MLPAMKVYVAPNQHDAHMRVFVVENPNHADIIIDDVVENPNHADTTVYIETNQHQADKKVYFAKGPPIPSIGVVVKSNAGGAPSNRTRMQRILTAADAPAEARPLAAQSVRYFPLPTDIVDGKYDIVITLPRAAMAAVAPASTRGDTELTFTVTKVPGGYDAVRPALVR